ncbi:DnaJ C-terminal domain-containing protein [Brevundimonas sp. NPDC092305]|uniref:DnaJ C-terminal domain-containing protein n=1 Tax=Brevundimonas sp. NPDC092305 TaxID=3363957 RepID=UPI00382F4A63
MRARSLSEVASLDEARALLDISGSMDAAAQKLAFRAAIKAARPAPGEDETRFRRLIAAWRLIQTDTASPIARPVPASPPTAVLTPIQALRGGRAVLQVDGRKFGTRLPRGLRSGDVIRVRDAGGRLTLPVLIRGEAGLSVIGDDLHMSWPVSPDLIEDGGRLEIETHAGPRSLWITPGQPSLRLRIRDLGLPARGDRPAGHLFVTLTPSSRVVSPTEERLARFTRVWTPDHLAA